VTLNIHIQGYGTLEIEHPHSIDRETFDDLASDVVAKVMQHVSPKTQGERFHPVLGVGGYVPVCKHKLKKSHVQFNVDRRKPMYVFKCLECFERFYIVKEHLQNALLGKAKIQW